MFLRGWINKLSNIHTIAYDLSIKRNTLDKLAWISLKGVLLNERSQSHKVKAYMTPCIWHAKKWQSYWECRMHGVIQFSGWQVLGMVEDLIIKGKWS